MRRPASSTASDDQQKKEEAVETLLRECLVLIKNGKNSEAKALVGDHTKWPDEPTSRGRVMALKGFLNSFNPKSHMGILLSDPSKIVAFRQIVRSRQTSVWSDDFDKGYFEVWSLALDLLENGGLGEHSGSQSGVENPDEKKERDKAP